MELFCPHRILINEGSCGQIKCNGHLLTFKILISVPHSVYQRGKIVHKTIETPECFHSYIFVTFENWKFCKSHHVIPHKDCDVAIMSLQVSDNGMDMSKKHLLARQFLRSHFLLTTFTHSNVVHLTSRNECERNITKSSPKQKIA